MSTDATPPAGEPAGKPKIVLLAIILIAGLLVGGGAGAFVAGPMLAGPAVHAEDSSDEHDGDERADGESRGAPPSRNASKEGPPVLYPFENLVLNPANTGGTRFLMLSAAFELRDSKTMDQMKQREFEVRDVVLSVLGAKTVEELADIGHREAIKEDLRKAVDGMFAPGSVRRVYMPQFVIQ